MSVDDELGDGSLGDYYVVWPARLVRLRLLAGVASLLAGLVLAMVVGWWPLAALGVAGLLIGLHRAWRMRRNPLLAMVRGRLCFDASASGGRVQLDPGDVKRVHAHRLVTGKNGLVNLRCGFTLTDGGFLTLFPDARDESLARQVEGFLKIYFDRCLVREQGRQRRWPPAG